jgi:hypothetical protein
MTEGILEEDGVDFVLHLSAEVDQSPETGFALVDPQIEATCRSKV